MSLNFGSKKIGSVYKGSVKIGQIYKGSELVYQSAFNVTYVVDTGVSYTEKVKPNASILSPTTFTPTKANCTFVGWRYDTTATANVLTNEVATKAVTLYAVFKKTVTATFKLYNTSSQKTGTLYYNNGNTVAPEFTAASGENYNGWTWRGWSAQNSTTANASVAFANNGNIGNLYNNATYYGLYYKTVTLSYNGGGSTSGSTASHTGNVYYNAYGNTLGATFTLKTNGFARTNYTFSRWAAGSKSGTKYNAGGSITITANTTMYAMWKASTKTYSGLIIKGYGNTLHGTDRQFPNHVYGIDSSAESDKYKQFSLDLTGFSKMSVYIGVFCSDTDVQNATKKDSRARVYIENTMVVDAATKNNKDNKTTYSSGNIDISSYTGNKAIYTTYYNMNGYCEANEVTITFTSSGLEI